MKGCNCKLCEHWRPPKGTCFFAPNMSVALRLVIRIVGCESYKLNKEISRAQRKKQGELM
jgi:hypothetical protein